ncbi:hypothetical protein HY57_01885 [Dyella japonica A8]|uniref:Uncharacterized protein n=1 Tax=Dyella japonica A8 TaxID=1217721 RepID=A0A075K1I7_9GAMM|nr:hypothetical protein HY57_01885 [Dyella japonica A8]
MWLEHGKLGMMGDPKSVADTYFRVVPSELHTARGGTGRGADAGRAMEPLAPVRLSYTRLVESAAPPHQD